MTDLQDDIEFKGLDKLLNLKGTLYNHILEENQLYNKAPTNAASEILNQVQEPGFRPGTLQSAIEEDEI